MELHTWLDLPENKGKATELAIQLGRTKGAVSLWREQGVPIVLFDAIVEFSGGAVTTDAMLKHAIACRQAAAEKAAAKAAA